MGPSTPTRALSPARGFLSKAQMQVKRIYRNSPRRFAVFLGITFFKVAILLSWAVPKLLPWEYLQSNIPKVEYTAVKGDPHGLGRGLGKVIIAP